MKRLVFFIALSPMIFCPVFHSFGDQTDSVAQKGIYHFILLLFWARWFTTCGGSSRLNAKSAISFLFFEFWGLLSWFMVQKLGESSKRRTRILVSNGVGGRRSEETDSILGRW